MASTAVVVLAAGRGTRMKSAIPKVLHPIAGRPMICYVVDAAKGINPEKVLLVVGHGGSEVRQLLGDAVDYVEQRQQLGTGHAVLQARSMLEDKVEHVVVLNGDVPLVLSSTLETILIHHLSASATLTFLTTLADEPAGLGRVVRGPGGQVQAILEDKEASDELRKIKEINSGIYCFDSNWLWPNVANLPRSKGGEFYLTDLVAKAIAQGKRVETICWRDPQEALGINNRVQLAQAEAIIRQRIREEIMLGGVTLIDPPSTFIDATAEIASDTVVYPNTTILGNTKIGRDCLVGPGAIIINSVIGDNCRVLASMVEDSTLEESVEIGPYSHTRPGSYICAGAHIGNFAEIKKSRLGRKTKMGHFSYVGDATVGDNVNIGAGTITCNFDGVHKHQTTIGDDVFVGSDSLFVAPVRVGDRAVTGAGSVVTRDVPDDTLAVGMPARHLPKQKPEDNQE